MEILAIVLVLLPLVVIAALDMYWKMKDSAIGDTEQPKKIDDGCKDKDKHCGDEKCCNKDGCGGDCGSGSKNKED